MRIASKYSSFGFLLCVLVLGVSGCSGDPRDESQVKMNKLQLALYEYAQSHDGEWPDKLEEIKTTVGGEAAYQELITNPVTGDSPGYEYIKPQGKPTDPDYNPRQVILHQLNGGKRDPKLKSGYTDGSFE